MKRLKKENAVCIFAVDNPVIAGPLPCKGEILMGKLTNCIHKQTQEDIVKYKGKEGCDFDCLFLVPAA